MLHDLTNTLRLGGHLKTGHTWPLQNRPTELSQDKSIYNPPMAVSANIIFVMRSEKHILANLGRRTRQRGDATGAPIQGRNGGRRKPPRSAAILAESDKSRVREGRALASKRALFLTRPVRFWCASFEVRT